MHFVEIMDNHLKDRQVLAYTMENGAEQNSSYS